MPVARLNAPPVGKAGPEMAEQSERKRDRKHETGLWPTGRHWVPTWYSGGHRSRWHQGVRLKWMGSPGKLQPVMLNLRQRSPDSIKHKD